MSEAFGPGTRFGGSDGARFLVEARAGKGGQAEVFRCHDSRLHRAVALKVCTAPDGTNRKLYLDRFEHELRMTSGVQHPHVLQVFDCGELPSGQPFVILEWMEHGSLNDLVRKQKETGRFLPLPYVRYYATAMAAGLRAAHLAQLVHRDVKPDNVLIAKDGVAKLTDFGIAKDLSSEAPQLTAIGSTLGTLGFMANEQLRGLPGPQSDIFSWGVSVFCLLFGRLPAQRQANTIPLGILEEHALDGVPASFLPILRRALAADLESRYPSFTEVLADLAAMNLDGADHRPLFAVGALPGLPSHAFVAGAGTPSGGQSVPRSGPSGGLQTDIGTARGNDMGLDGYGETEAFDVVSGSGVGSGPRPTVVPGAEPPSTQKIDTRATTRVPPAPLQAVAAPSPQAEAAPGPTRAAAVQPGPTRLQTLRSEDLDLLDSPEESGGGKPMNRALIGVLAAAAVLGIGLAALLGRAPDLDPAAEAAAALDYGVAIVQGDPAAAALAGARLEAAAAERPAGRLVSAWDALVAGQLDAARTFAEGLSTESAPLSGSAAAILGAALRRSGPEHYAEALAAHRRAAACVECGPIGTAAGAAIAQDCAVLGPLDGCGESLTGWGARDRELFAAAVLQGDGHAAAAQERLAGALAIEGAPSCLQTQVLRSFAAGSPLASPASVQALRAAARAPRDCVSPGGP